MGMIGRIRRLQSRKNKSEREISRMTELSRKTVAKWLHGEVDGPPKYRRGEQPTSFLLPAEAGDLLRAAAGTIIAEPPDFRRLLKETGVKIVPDAARPEGAAPTCRFALGRRAAVKMAGYSTADASSDGRGRR